MERYTLITNLEWIWINGVRIWTHALLLVHEPDPQSDPTKRHESERAQLRGFGVDPAWDVFDMFVESAEHELHDAQGNIFKLNDDGSLDAVIKGAVLTLKNGPEIQLVTSDNDKPLDIETIEGPKKDAAGERLIRKVWRRLKVKVARYWRSPNMPTLSWLPADHVRESLRWEM